MLEFEYSDIINRHIRLSSVFPLPVVLCTRDWEVYWANELANRFCPHVTDTKGLRQVLAEFDMTELAAEAARTGSCLIRDIFPLTRVDMITSAILDKGRIACLVLFFVQGGNRYGGMDYYKSTKVSDAFSDSIRGISAEMFSLLDLASAKADLLNAGWIKPILNQISYGNYRMLRAAANISEYSRSQSGIMNLRFQQVDIVSLLHEIEEDIKLFDCEIGIPVEFKLPKSKQFVNLDLARFEVAFFNIIHNSLYYTRPDNRVLVTLNRRGRDVILRISDSGLGIPAHALSTVTDPYSSYDHDEATRSTGLGLAVAKAIIEAHGGKLTVRSKHGSGTAVTVTLPLRGNPRTLELGMSDSHYRLNDRFSPIYIGLADVVNSPFRTNKP